MHVKTKRSPILVYSFEKFVTIYIRRTSDDNDRVIRVTVHDFECKNKRLFFVAKLYICYCRIRDFIKILYPKCQRYLLLSYFITVDLVTSPQITALGLCNLFCVSQCVW